MANFEDFPPIFCPTADFLPQGGGRILVKYSRVAAGFRMRNNSQHRVQRGARVLLHEGGINNKCSISSDLTFRDL